jgi:uncharacterized protein YggE
VSPCPPSEIVGYTVTQTVKVKVRDFAKIGDIMSGVVKNGANNVSSLSFTIDDPAKLQDEARAKAIAEAKSRAEEIAKAGGFKLGKLVAIDDMNGIYGYKMYDSAVGRGGLEMSANASAPVPAIEPGSEEVTINVVLRYQIR